MKKIRLTESDLHRIIENTVINVLKENSVGEMGTPKQNSFLRKLMGDRYKDEYDNLPVPEASKMIDAELKKQTPSQNTGVKYVVIDTNTKEHPTFDTFREAKKYFNDAVEEYLDLPFGGDVSMYKVSDICYKFVGRNSGHLGSLYIKKITQ